jgi:hypothetical protein
MRWRQPARARAACPAAACPAVGTTVWGGGSDGADLSLQQSDNRAGSNLQHLHLGPVLASPLHCAGVLLGCPPRRCGTACNPPIPTLSAWDRSSLAQPGATDTIPQSIPSPSRLSLVVQSSPRWEITAGAQSLLQRRQHLPPPPIPPILLIPLPKGRSVGNATVRNSLALASPCMHESRCRQWRLGSPPTSAALLGKPDAASGSRLRQQPHDGRNI